jgi:hypothetical protein
LTVLLAAIILKGLAEMLLLVLFGQGLLYLLAGSGRHENLVYRMFKAVTAPLLKVVRLITPRFIVDSHIGLVAFFLVALLWVMALALKVNAGVAAGVPAPG